MSLFINTKTGKTRRIIDSPSLQEQLESRLFIFNDKLERDWIGLRNYRNLLLSESDWVVTKASEEGTVVSDDWKTYRQSLRNLPEHENAPNKFMIADWPLSPNETELPDGAIGFIAEISDPVGLGTTSFVGITTTGEYYDQTPEPEPEPEEEIPPQE